MNRVALNGSDVLLAMLRSTMNTSIPHDELVGFQWAAAVRIVTALGRRPLVVLADDVGLGKTHVAAAVGRWFAARRISVELIVPAFLVPQWIGFCRQLSLDAQVFSHESLHRRELYPSGGERLVIVDEAHRFRNPSTRRYGALARCVIGQRVLLVTATPICNRLEDLLALLRLGLADDCLRDAGVASLDRAFSMRRRRDLDVVMQRLTIRRDRSMVASEVPDVGLRRHVVRHRVGDPEQHLRSILGELRFPLIAPAVDPALLRSILWRRLESSEDALRDSLRRQRRFYLRARELIRRGARITKREFRSLFGTEGADAPFQDLLFPEVWLDPQEAAGDHRAIDDEIGRIDRLLAAILRMPGRKLESLLGILRSEPSERAIVFTSAIPTACAIFGACCTLRRAALVTSRRCRDPDGRPASMASLFESLERGEVDLLVATDLASEGLNLQSVECIIHYDIPWNPVKLDQRNGRARRLGQRKGQVRSFYFLPERRSDPVRLLQTLVAKNRSRRPVLGERQGGTAPPLAATRCLDLALEATRSPGPRWLISTDLNAVLIETAGRAKMVLVGSPALTSDWCSIEERLLSGSGNLHTVDRSEIEQGIEAQLAAWRSEIRSRRLLPPVLDRSSPQCALLARLCRKSLSRRPLIDLLARRYRIGVETLIAEMADEFLDLARMRFLEAVLQREIDLSPEPDPATARAIAAVFPADVSELRSSGRSSRSTSRC